MNKKIVEYKVICFMDSEELNKIVNEMIWDRWQPLGKAIFNTQAYSFYQTMVKYEEEKMSPRGTFNNHVDKLLI